MARDFEALPVTARLLVEHLSPRPADATQAAEQQDADMAAHLQTFAHL